MNDSFGCIHCIYLDKSDIPIDERKCTNKIAITPHGDYMDENGVESDKSWIRQNDIEREQNGDRSLPLPRKDANLYFMCDHFDDGDGTGSIYDKYNKEEI